MPGSIKLALLWAAYSLSTLTSAKTCSMVSQDTVSVRNNVGDRSKISRGSELTQPLTNAMCQTDTGKMSFGVAVEIAEDDSFSKSHIVMSDENCNVVDLIDFPDDDDCDDYEVLGNYMPYVLTIQHYKRARYYVASKIGLVNEIQIDFVYGSGQHVNGRDDADGNPCGCTTIYPSPGADRSFWGCSCPFSKDGSA